MHQKHSLEGDQRQLVSFVAVDDSQHEKQSRIISVAVKRDGRLLSPGKGIKITSVVAEGPENKNRSRTHEAAGRQKAPQGGGSRALKPPGVARLSGKTKKQAEHKSASPSQRESESER